MVGSEEFFIPVEEWKLKSDKQKLDLKDEYGNRLHITDPGHEWPFDKPEKRYMPPSKSAT